LPIVACAAVCMVLLYRQSTMVKGEGHPPPSPSVEKIDTIEGGVPSTHQPAGQLILRPEHDGQAAVDVHLLVIWNGAMSKRQQILTHVQEHFHVLDVKYFDWEQLGKKHELIAPAHDPQADYFLMNLWRLYSGKGGGAKTSMPLKTRQCGRGPFIGLVVVDPRPAYRTETTAHGDDYVNHNMNDAKKLYRKWSGGGYKVHGTFNPTEAAHDVTLMFHRHPTIYAQEYRMGGGSAAAAERSETLIKAFHSQQPWPPGPGTAFYGPEGTLGLSSREEFLHASPELPPWPSCTALIEAVTTPWPSKEQRRLTTESFYGWDAEASYPSDALKVEDCASWPDEWALVVPVENWWALTSLLNANLTPELLSAAAEGKPEVVEVHVHARKAPFRIHVRGIVIESTGSG
jgi:hypothetical protein